MKSTTSSPISLFHTAEGRINCSIMRFQNFLSVRPTLQLSNSVRPIFLSVVTLYLWPLIPLRSFTSITDSPRLYGHQHL